MEFVFDRRENIVWKEKMLITSILPFLSDKGFIQSLSLLEYKIH